MRIKEHIRILPLLLLTAMLSFSVRISDLFFNPHHSGVAYAQHEVMVEPPSAMKMAAADEHHEEPVAEIDGNLDLGAEGDAITVKPEVAGAENSGEALVRDGKPVEWKDATDTDIEQSAVREEIYTDLAKRREQLDKREKEIAVREALLSAAEREVDQKVRELNNIKSEIEGMMTKVSEEDEARITSLVKIYEGMKPKDAASIFNTLDLDILVELMERMSERKSSPILSEMNQDRARTVTIMMAQRSKSSMLQGSN